MAVLKKKKGRLFALVGIAFGLYVATYIVMSRHGYALADRYDMKGFYYLMPEESDSWRFWNYTWVWVFCPLNTIDRWIGLGRAPAYEPLWRFGKRPSNEATETK